MKSGRGLFGTRHGQQDCREMQATTLAATGAQGHQLFGQDGQCKTLCKCTASVRKGVVFPGRRPQRLSKGAFEQVVAKFVLNRKK